MSNPFAPHRTHPAALTRTPGHPHKPKVLADIQAIGFFDWNVRSGEITWSRGAEQGFGGIERATIADFERWSAQFEPDDLAALHNILEKAERQGDDRLVFRCRFHAPDEAMLIEGIALCWYDEAFRLDRLSGVMLDVTAHDRDKQTLARSEAQLRTLIATAPDASIMIDASGIITGFNLSAERMFGIAAEEAVGSNVARLMPDEMAARHDDVLDAYLNGRPARVIGKARQLTGRRGDGNEFPIELNVGEVRVDDEPMFIAFVRDLTERVEAAQRLEDLRERYLRNSRLNLMGTVAAGLAHELNQPLSAGSNFLAAAEIMLKAHPEPGEAPELLQRAREQILLAGDIIRRLRGFLAPGGAPAERVELGALVEEAGALALFGRSRFEIRLSGHCAPGAEVVQADRIQLLQVLVNLIRNAAGVLAGRGEDGEIRIRAVPEGEWTAITVSDNGPGFPRELLERTDDIFRSSRNEGMGLGLTICRRIIEGWGGRFTLGNATDGGAEIRFTVPMALDPEALTDE